MVQSNKILTVSYGTFSCTLEGFDDSFGTMKAIAEYFRDLASDDRYFGAEPPQPDADMLARIAQREISRQVEARQETGGGFVLRAADAAAPAALATAATVAAQTAEVAEQPRQAAPVATPAPAEHAPVQPAPVEAVQTPAPAPVAEPVTHSLLSEAVDKSRLDAQDNFDDGDQVDAHAHIPTAEPIDETAPAGDSIAAKLQRIRAVVSRNEAQETSEFSEDEHADSFVASAVSDLNDALEEDDQIALEETPAEDIAADRELAEAFDRFEDDADDNFEDIITETTEDEMVAFSDEEDLQDTFEELDDDGSYDADLDTAEIEEIEEVETSLPVSEIEGDDVGTALAAVAQSMHDSDGSAQEVYEELDQAADAGNADKGIDLSQFLVTDGEAETTAQASTTLEEEVGVLTGLDDEDPDEDFDVSDLQDDDVSDMVEEPREDVDTNDQELLSAEDEADLIRELADVEADLAPDYSEEERDEVVNAIAESDEDDAAQDHTTLPPAADEAEEDLSRLMAAAEEKMDAPENSTSRETYSHLRAAVAAAEAERSAGGDVDGNAQDDMYREDLASVVRPRRPVPNAAVRPQRPNTESRPAPLKLVAEQRIDTETQKSTRGPVRPRRVSATAMNADLNAADAADGGFAEFAAEMGATDLPDLLEAAAAYLSFVEGRDQFSRPQLMNKVRQVEANDFNREDGLRSFGQLLREGKIEKTGGGRFTASGDIGFRPDDERAAG